MANIFNILYISVHGKGASYMLMFYDGYQGFNSDAVENMPSWVRQEKYYNCDDFFNIIAPRRKSKKDKKKNRK